MDTRLAKRGMNIDHFCTDAITACGLASTPGRLTCILGLLGDRRTSIFEWRITFRLHPGRDLQNHQSAIEPAVRCRGCFWSTSGKVGL
jgi:hypothetical protein